MGKKILVTGGAGFIGSHVVEALHRTLPDRRIIVLDDLSSGSIDNISCLDVDFEQGSILDQPLLTRCASGASSIVHLAALGSVPRSIANPRATMEVNTTGTFHVLESARESGVNQVVFSSSSSVYGANPALPKKESDWTRPLSPYAATKLAGEGLFFSYRQSFGLRSVVFRFFNVFGPRQDAENPYAAVIPKFIKSVATNSEVTIYGDGQQVRDFTFIGPVAEAVCQAVSSSMDIDSPVNLAFGQPTTIKSLAEEVGRQFSREPRIVFNEARIGDILASYGSSKVFRKYFPNVDNPSLSDGLQETIAWYKRKSIE